MDTQFITKTVKQHAGKAIGISSITATLALFVWLQDHIVWKADFKEHLATEAESHVQHEKDQSDRLSKMEDRVHELEHLLMKPRTN